jgi:hypothetical protein
MTCSSFFVVSPPNVTLRSASVPFSHCAQCHARVVLVVWAVHNVSRTLVLAPGRFPSTGV